MTIMPIHTPEIKVAMRRFSFHYFNRLTYLTTWLLNWVFGGIFCLTPQQKLVNDSWACSFDKRVPLKSCQLQGSWSLVVFNLKLYIVTTPYPPRRMLLWLFQHTFGTHPFRNLYQWAFFRDSFHSWCCRGNCKKRVCSISRMLARGFSLPGIPSITEKNPSNRQGKHPQNLASRKGFRKVVEVLDVGCSA